MWNTRDTPPLQERIGWVATPIYHDLGHHESSAVPRPRPSCNSRRQILQETADAREQTLWPRTQTLAPVLLQNGRSQRLKKTETPQKKPPKVHGL